MDVDPYRLVRPHGSRSLTSKTPKFILNITSHLSVWEWTVRATFEYPVVARFVVSSSVIHAEASSLLMKIHVHAHFYSM